MYLPLSPGNPGSPCLPFNPEIPSLPGNPGIPELPVAPGNPGKPGSPFGPVIAAPESSVYKINIYYKYSTYTYIICDRLCENRPCSHLLVIRETLV